MCRCEYENEERKGRRSPALPSGPGQCAHRCGRWQRGYGQCHGKIARENDIPLYRDETLAHTLVELGLGVEIPRELYEAVAKVLVHVAALDKKLIR
ncbi:EscU/YscU/HrcU family type III secretion system export apparatus switch protein [Desulforamulus profundi]|uniref:EscU/YscU/HrcU family type III secretion system export apparatus switch protein n=1 Tax=Desulforamulus profundi TaxID=1383067 RepID=UPI001EE57BC5|nr:EscU/YscU/HrcU family type III secretion system export apparatus switch protein [Desulforamulus profundi]